MSKIRPVAIYLPQFHPIRENNEWWGKGFTEWTKVTEAKPLFKGHLQPHLPSDLGFYDLRVPEVREAQAELAKENGIYGFCYYHYWFNGRRVLERPFQEVFESGKPDFPFMLCWANENWTRTWDGGTTDILIEQKYSFEDDINHIKILINYFKDPRYIRIDGKPVFAIYRSSVFPDMKKTLKMWREEALKHNIELYLCRFESFGDEKNYLEDGFDASVEFQPHAFTGRQKEKVKTWKDEITIQTMSFAFSNKIKLLKRALGVVEQIGVIESYKEIIKHSLSYRTDSTEYKRYRMIMPGFDNSARKRKDFFIVKDSTPERFGYWLEELLKTITPYTNEENLFFINAWNEWAEGNHLEPCRKWNNGYLQQLKIALDKLYKQEL